MEKRAKAETYINFCLRARKIALGSGAVEYLKKGAYLIMVCSTASQNTFKLAQKFARRHSCPLMVCNCGLENAVHKPGCKITAVTDLQLAKAITAAADENYELYAGGIN